ncbi:collagen-like protein [Aeromicrobium sp. 9AM]|uniref:collagen-like protein n=1 Tax=Aeromicrobium sp. 9AM TaxID=2653126 RepID=UPI0012EFE2FE|nr:collagen-like protein [Aeromicrobium sp. 9AM]VXB81523.1 exported hypothetical protein [Aeromicrobium sp. 9AM]
MMNPSKSIRLRHIALAVILAIAAVCFYAIFTVVNGLSDRLDTAEDHASSSSATAADAVSRAKVLEAQVKQLGGTPAVSVPTKPSTTLDNPYVPVPGPAGRDGRDGRSITGPPGESITGPPGDSVTGPQGAVGPAGSAGKDGTDGKDGRSITSTSCQSDGTWLITYSDDTTQTVDGPCRIVLPPE